VCDLQMSFSFWCLLMASFITFSKRALCPPGAFLTIVSLVECSYGK
jgi:hypothetical protein